MQKNLNLRFYIKSLLKFVSLALFLTLVFLIAYGYFIVKPSVNENAIENNQKITINIKQKLAEAKQQDKVSAQTEESSNTQQITSDSNGHVQQFLQDKLNEEGSLAKLAPSSDPLPTDQSINIDGKSQDANITKDNSQTEETNADNNTIERDSNQMEEDDLNDKTSERLRNQIDADNIDSRINKETNQFELQGEPYNNQYSIKKTKIAILVTHLGLGTSITELAIGLPQEIAFGFSAYTNSLRNLLNKAKTEGHEIFIEMPFETEKYPLDDVGPLGILTTLDNGENSSRLYNILSSFNNINGVYSLPNEKFTDNPNLMEPILDILGRNRLLLLYGKGSSNVNFLHLLNQYNVPILNCDIYIDLSTEYELIKSKLELLEKISKDKGKALGFINSYPITINMLSNWIKNLDSKGIELVPVSSILDK